jgi:hypothetical protein
MSRVYDPLRIRDHVLGFDDDIADYRIAGRDKAWRAASMLAVAAIPTNGLICSFLTTPRMHKPGRFTFLSTVAIGGPSQSPTIASSPIPSLD